MKPKVLVFASGSRSGGGSGLYHLLGNEAVGNFPGEIVGTVSSYESGGVFKIAQKFNKPFRYFSDANSATAEHYQFLVEEFQPDFIILSGWMHLCKGLNPAKTINIHPAPLDDYNGIYGGGQMYGMNIHRAIVADRAPTTGITQHFVTDEYDKGPNYFHLRLHVDPDDDAESLQARVNRYEHGWQWEAMGMVVSGEISWTGRSEDEIIVPEWYKTRVYCPDRLRVK